MKSLRLTLAGAALAAALPSLAASGSAITATPADNDAVATQSAQIAPMKVAMATPKDAAQRTTPRSLTDAPARKYDEEQAAPDKPYRLEHARWTHDEDHAY